MADVMGKPFKYELTDWHAVRPGHDRRYALDGTKLKDKGWVAPVPFKEALKRYIDWTRLHPTWL
jgi:dTDP-glucose 4,6-dehydratase